jgi:uncharacterized membrane protein YfcA
MSYLLDPALLGVLLLAYLLGGSVKGILGIGLPLMAVPILATSIGPAKAIATLVVPAIVSNIVQARHGGFSRPTIKRFGAAAVAMMFGAVIGSKFLANVDVETASLGLGVVVIFFCISQFVRVSRPIPKSLEKTLTPTLGVLSGIAGGFTGFFGVPMVPYLIALRLDKNQFVATIGLLYLCSTVALHVSLWDSRILTEDELLASVAASVPTLAGVWLGSRIRHRIAQETFRKLLLITLLLIGLNLMRKAFF